MTGADSETCASLTSMDRRRFLALAGLTAVATGAGGILPLGVRAAPARPPGGSSSTLALAAGPTAAPPWEGHPDATLTNYMGVLEALAHGVRPTAVPLLPVFLAADVRGLTPVAAYRLMITTVSSADILHDYVSVVLRRTIEKARLHRTTRAGTLAWGGAEAAEAVVIAFRRTGDTAFLDLFVDYFDDVLRLRDHRLGLRDSRLGRAVPAWGDGQVVRGKWIAHVTTAGRICYAATEFARVTLGTASLSRYHATAQRYVAATERALAVFDGDFRRVAGTRDAYYRRPAAGRWEPLNHAHQVGRVLLDLHALTGERRYRWRATQIARVFERSVRFDRRGRPFWRYFPYFEPTGDDQRAECIWKASVTVPFIHQAAQRGWTDPAIIEAAARSFADRIVRGGELNRTIDPVRFVKVQPGDHHGACIASWIELAPRYPAITGQVAGLLVSHRSDYLERGWFRRPSVARGYAMGLGDGPPGNLDLPSSM